MALDVRRPRILGQGDHRPRRRRGSRRPGPSMPTRPPGPWPGRSPRASPRALARPRGRHASLRPACRRSACPSHVCLRHACRLRLCPCPFCLRPAHRRCRERSRSLRPSQLPCGRARRRRPGLGRCRFRPLWLRHWGRVRALHLGRCDRSGERVSDPAPGGRSPTPNRSLDLGVLWCPRFRPRARCRGVCGCGCRDPARQNRRIPARAGTAVRPAPVRPLLVVLLFHVHRPDVVCRPVDVLDGEHGRVHGMVLVVVLVHAVAADGVHVGGVAVEPAAMVPRWPGTRRRNTGYALGIRTT